MQTAWTIAGAILGWVSIEVVAVFSKVGMPISFNIGMAFVGGLAAYTFFN